MSRPRLQMSATWSGTSASNQQHRSRTASASLPAGISVITEKARTPKRRGRRDQIFHLKNTMNTSIPKPLVSIVLPCRNEQGYIQDCLQSILNQQPPDGGIEILAADGMSTDGTRDYLSAMARNHPQLRILDNPGRIVSTGLNAAIREARGDIIVRMDAHTTYASDYVQQCLAVLKETGADNVGGPMQTTATTYKERAIRAVFHSAFAVGGARSHLANYEGYVDTVIYGCWEKGLFQRIGCFDEELVRNQDDEHNFRLVRGGGK